ncbi:MAG TPA: glycosyltransferase family 4 protein [Bryobacteraceae bacterium]|nr:glycosyltransferase family 4 protein [Bryobacteraceae bacterium]
MNVLFLDQFSDLGGAQRCLLDLLPAVCERGWQAHLAAPGEGRLCAEARRRGATVDEIPCGPFHAGRKSLGDAARFAGQAPRLRRRIGELARRYHADLIYINGPRLLPACPRGTAVLFHCHSRVDWPYTSLLAWGLRGAAVVGSCRFVLEPLRRYLREGRSGVVYNGVAGGCRARRARGRRVGVIGRIAPEKGQAEFLAAAREAPEARFVICGEVLFGDSRAAAYAERLRALARGLDVEFTGWRDDAGAVLRELDVLVAPSVGPEATTRVILEAFAAGVPVVAFRTGGIPEVIEDGMTGFLVEKGSPGALSARIREVLAMPAERLEAVAERAFEAWRERFTLERYQEEMLEKMERAALDSART